MKLLLLILSALAALAQTKDLSPRSIGSYTVATLPAAASWSGYTAVVTDAATAGSCTSGGGSALSLCRSSGAAWATLGGGGGTASGLATTCTTSNTRVEVSAGIGRIGGVDTAIGAFHGTLSGASSTSTIFVYIDPAGTVSMGHNGAATLTCSGCTTVPGVTAFPDDTTHISTAGYVSNACSTGTIESKVPTVGRDIDVPGAGLSRSSNAAGVNTWALTTTLGSGTFAARPSCGAGVSSFYISTNDPGLTSLCNSGAWTDFYANTPITRGPAAASYTVANTLTVTDSGGTVNISKAVSGLGVALVALPDTGAAWEVTLKINPYGMWTFNQECGLWVTNGTTAGTHNAQGLVFGLSKTAGDTQLRLLTRNYVPINGGIGAGALDGMIVANVKPTALKLVRSAGNFLHYIGDGTNWTLVSTEASLFTATHYGVGCDPRASVATAVKVLELSVL